MQADTFGLGRIRELFSACLSLEETIYFRGSELPSNVHYPHVILVWHHLAVRRFPLGCCAGKM
jgi:hypothetical protein